MIQYETPRVYYNNRWMYGDPAISRVDSSIDFAWSEDDLITPTGRDFISVVWSGHLLASFSEVYIFTIHVNDGARLWVDDYLLIDAYDNEADEESFTKYSAELPFPLDATSLVSIRLEYRENRGMAIIKLLWQSASQPLEIIPASRFFSHMEQVIDSPFTIKPIGIKASAPTACQLNISDISDWDKLLVTWNDPHDDGGQDISNFLVEYWDATPRTYGTTEIK